MHNFDNWYNLSKNSYKGLTCPNCYSKIYNNICTFCGEYYDNDDIENLDYLYKTYKELDVDSLRYDKKDYVIYFIDGDVYKFVGKDEITTFLKSAKLHTYAAAKVISTNYNKKGYRTWYFDNINNIR